MKIINILTIFCIIQGSSAVAHPGLFDTIVSTASNLLTNTVHAATSSVSGVASGVGSTATHVLSPLLGPAANIFNSTGVTIAALANLAGNTTNDLVHGVAQTTIQIVTSLAATLNNTVANLNILQGTFVGSIIDRIWQSLYNVLDIFFGSTKTYKNEITDTSYEFSQFLDYIEEGLRSNISDLKAALKHFTFDPILGGLAFKAEVTINSFFNTISTILGLLDDKVIEALDVLVMEIHHKTSKSAFLYSSFLAHVTHTLSEFATKHTDATAAKTCLQSVNSDLVTIQSVFFSNIQQCVEFAVAEVDEGLEKAHKQLKKLNATINAPINHAKHCIADVFLSSSLRFKNKAAICLEDALQQRLSTEISVQEQVIIIQEHMLKAIAKGRTTFDFCIITYEDLLPKLSTIYEFEEIPKCYE